jgi:Fe-S cluster assembly iron-binding protein IscA
LIIDNDQGSSLVNFKEDMMVSITDGAVTKFKEVVIQQGTAGDGIRIFLVPGG